MARRRTDPRELPDALRDAVERTVESTLGSAGRSRDAAQGALDDLAGTVDDLRRGAEDRLVRSRKAVAEVIDTRRPATYEDIRDLQKELRAIGRRLDAIEERLPAADGRQAQARRQAQAGRQAQTGRQARRLMAGRRVLITGVGSHVGAGLAARLERDPRFEHVAGLDTRMPAEGLGRTELIEADIRNPVITKLIAPLEVDTVVHNQIIRQPGPGMSARAMHDVNVIGSLQLLAALEKAPTVRTIVVRGSAGIYGAEPGAPQFFDERMTRLFPLRSRFQRDVAEIENYFETYSRRHPDVSCTMLRYQPAIGPSLDTQVTRYLSLPACPTYLGFDPRIQLIHEEDGMNALVAAVANPVRGAVNVAGEGTIGLARMVRTAGRAPLPVAGPLFGPVTSLARRAGMSRLSEDFRRLLRYGRGVDITRLVEEVGFRPRHSTVDAVQEWGRTRSGLRLTPSVRAAA